MTMRTTTTQTRPTPPHGLVQGDTDALLRRREVLVSRDDAPDYGDDLELVRLDAEFALRGHPTSLEVVLPAPDAPSTDRFRCAYALELERRAWLCRTTAAEQYPLVGSWRVVVVRRDAWAPLLCVPERVVLVSDDVQLSRKSEAMVLLALGALEDFAEELCDLGLDPRGVEEALGLTRREIAKLGELAEELSRSLERCAS